MTILILKAYLLKDKILRNSHVHYLQIRPKSFSFNNF